MSITTLKDLKQVLENYPEDTILASIDYSGGATEMKGGIFLNFGQGYWDDKHRNLCSDIDNENIDNEDIDYPIPTPSPVLFITSNQVGM